MRVLRKLLAVVMAVGLVVALAPSVVSAVPPLLPTVYVATTGSDTTGDGTESNPFLTIAKGVQEVAVDGTVHVSAGTYEISQTIIIAKQGISVSGPSTGTAKVVGTAVTAVTIFSITAHGVSLTNLELTVSAIFTSYPTGEPESSLVRVNCAGGDTGVSIQNNELYVPLQTGPMSGWVARAIDVVSTGPRALISGNTIYNTRNGVVVHYGSTATTGNNIIYNTKGGIMNYTSNQADADNRVVSGNSWGTVHNEWDIVWNSGGALFVPDYQQSVLALSSLNNGAYVLDRRGLDTSNVIGNRSHVFVQAGSSHTTQTPAKGNSNEPYAFVQLGVDAAVSGGTVNAAAGTFTETGILIAKGLNLVGSGMDATTIDASSFTAEGNVLSVDVASGNVGVTGFKIITGTNRHAIHAKAAAGSTITIDGNAILGSGAAALDSHNFGLIAGYGSLGKMVFKNNVVTDTGDNSVLFERQFGETEVSGNVISGYWASIYYMNHSGASVTTLQKVYNNTIDLATAPSAGVPGVCFVGGYSSWRTIDTTGGFTNVLVDSNHVLNVGDGNRGITFWNDKLGGTGAELVSPVMTNNIITGSGTTSRGIQVIGLVTGADIRGNTVSGVAEGFRGWAYDTGRFPTGTVLTGNSFVGCGTWGVNWQGTAGTAQFDSTGNWWGHKSGANHTGDSSTGQGDGIIGNVLHDPWYIDSGLTTLSNALTLTTHASGGVITRSDDNAPYSYGETVALTAMPDEDWRFRYWTGDASGSSNPQSLVMDGNKTVGAVFRVIPPPPPPPGKSGAFEEKSTDSIVEVDVPAGISENPVLLTISPPGAPPPTDGNPNLGAYDIELKDAKTGEAITELTKSITITFHYTAAMLAAAGVTDPHDLVIWYWDEDALPEACWVALPTIVDEATGTISTTVDHLTTFIAMVDKDFPKLPDIAGHWAQADILRLASYGAVGGYADGTFKPETAVTRAQYAKFIVATLNIAKGTVLPAGFKDASDVQDWAVPYLAACLRDGIMTGANSLLRPNATITRVEAAAMVVRALNLTVGGGTSDALTFTDAAAIPAWATAYVAEAVQHKLIEGLPGNVFDPTGTLTRAQAATVLSHAVDAR